MHNDSNERFFLWVAAVGASMVALSIAIASILGELGHVLWWILVPVGMLGGFSLVLGGLAIHFTRRRLHA